MKTEQLWFRMYANLPEQMDVVALRMKLGWEGFGIYIGILCMLRRSADGTMPTDYNQIGWHLHSSNDKVKSVINDFGLFTLAEDGKRFFNQDLTEEMKRVQSMLDERSEAGRFGAEKRWRTKAEQNSNGDAISIPAQEPETMANATETIANATLFDGLKQNKKDAYNTSYCIKQSDASDSFDGGTPVGVGLPKNKFQDDFFNQLDDRWQAIMQRWYAHKKKLSPKFRNMKILKENFEYLTELSGGDIDCAEAIVDYSIKQCYSGLFKPAMGRGGKSAKPSKKKDVKYSNDAWGNSQENLPKVELKIDENGNPCPF